MSDDLIKKVKENIIKNNLISKNDKILLMISGGGDSVALFYVLNKLKEEMNFEISLFHLNHKIREQADNDAMLVKNIAKRENVKLFYFEEDIEKKAKEEKLSLEEAGRKARYNLAFKILKAKHLDKIATAHHITDNAESILLNLIRGSGIKGTCSIENKNKQIIRPFIDITKEEILSFLDKRNIEYATDLTNFDTNYNRNFIRHEILPRFDKVNNQASKHLLNFSRTQSMVYDLITSLANEAPLKIKENEASVNISQIENKKDIVKIQILFNMMEKAGLRKDINYNQIENILNLIEIKTTFDINLTNNYVIKRRYDLLSVSKIKKEESNDFLYTVDIKNLKENEEVIIENNLFILKFLKINKNIFKKCNVKYVDCGKIQNSIKIRNRLTGDKFSPFGLNGEKTIKKYFIDEKIPKEKRNQIPLVLSEKDIIYVGGKAISEKYKINEATKEILVINFIEKEKKS